MQRDTTGLAALRGGESSEEKIEQILDCLVQMNEQYQYILCQLQNQQTGQNGGGSYETIQL